VKRRRWNKIVGYAMVTIVIAAAAVAVADLLKLFEGQL
jgi:hypothetical protein